MKKKICTWLLMVPAVWEQVLQERVKESHSEAGFFIINAGSSLLPPTKGEFSPVKSEAIALDRACISCQHWLYYAENEHLISDFSGILDMLNKNLCDISNRKLHYGTSAEPHFFTNHISGQSNKVCDALSWLCRNVSGYSKNYPSRPPRLLNLSKKPAKHVKDLEYYDPEVQELVEEASLDSDYLEMLGPFEIKVETKDLPQES